MFTQYPHFHIKCPHYIYTYVYTYNVKEVKHVSSKTVDITCQRTLRWNIYTYVYTYDTKEGKHVSSKTVDIKCQRRLRWNM